ncbi:ester cyclase [Kribbella shirazensis]|uniref:SnoaL-like domain-containing protein n=1 Tax=Kribbella shirazensis TaxID=1105143 RepID=A0A7X5VK04_9ACTN|nr:nuclear transport factor 2 family protein [Kribbella shirazensis]NIK62489.1 hypothetical protein [Kribbella shirazensis]
MTSSLEQLAARYGEAWNAHDLDRIMAMHTADTVFRLHLSAGPEVVGVDAVRSAFGGLLTLFPDIVFRTEVMTFGNDFFVHQALITATLAMPLPFGNLVARPTGQPMTFTGVDVITVADGLVQRKETYLDISAAQQQLGMLGEVAV